MNAADVGRLYAYNDWANERILGALEALPDEQRRQTIPSSFPSMLETLAHIEFAEWLWLRRFVGQSSVAQAPWASFEELRDRLRVTAANRRAYLEELSDEKLSAQLAYTSIKGDPFSVVLSDLLTHCANHSTYHRGQLVTMLRQVGAKPPGTDFSEFARTFPRSE